MPVTISHQILVTEWKAMFKIPDPRIYDHRTNLCQYERYPKEADTLIPNVLVLCHIFYNIPISNRFSQKPIGGKQR